MDPQAPASFIPKKSLDSGVRVRGSGALGGFLFLISLFFFVVSIAAAGAVFAYKGFLTKSIADATASLEKSKELFDDASIQDLLRVDLRIKKAAILLQQHTASTAFFAFLSTQTLQSVQFSSLDYALQDDGSAQVVLNGVANSFSTLALQSDQFGSSAFLKDVVFSGINVDAQGKVAFNVKATVDPVLLNYAKNLTTVVTPTPATQGTTTVTTATTTRTQTPAPTFPAPPNQ